MPVGRITGISNAPELVCLKMRDANLVPNKNDANNEQPVRHWVTSKQKDRDHISQEQEPKAAGLCAGQGPRQTSRAPLKVKTRHVQRASACLQVMAKRTAVNLVSCRHEDDGIESN